jgi:hypothetical protein
MEGILKGRIQARRCSAFALYQGAALQRAEKLGLSTLCIRARVYSCREGCVCVDPSRLQPAKPGWKELFSTS